MEMSGFVGSSSEKRMCNDDDERQTGQILIQAVVYAKKS